MTGYSNLRSEKDGFTMSIIVKTTNHRNLDLQIRIPSTLEPVELGLRRLVKNQVARGHVELTVNVDRASSTEIQIDRKLLDAYVGIFHKLRSEFGAASDPDLLA